MYCGAYILDSRRADSIKKAGKSSTTPSPRGTNTRRPHKPFKEMTGDEYMHWVNGQGGGVF